MSAPDLDSEINDLKKAIKELEEDIGKEKQHMIKHSLSPIIGKRFLLHQKI